MDQTNTHIPLVNSYKNYRSVFVFVGLAMTKYMALFLVDSPLRRKGVHSVKELLQGEQMTIYKWFLDHANKNNWDAEVCASSLLATFYRENPSLFPTNGYPTPIVELTHWCGVKTISWPTTAESAIDTTATPANLYLRPNTSYTNHRFGIAHALGHLFLHKPDKYDYTVSIPELEKEANDFAVRLLMPAEYFYAEAHVNGYDSLANKFQVSELAARYRLHMLRLL